MLLIYLQVVVWYSRFSFHSFVFSASFDAGICYKFFLFFSPKITSSWSSAGRKGRSCITMLMMIIISESRVIIINDSETGEKNNMSIRRIQLMILIFRTSKNSWGETKRWGERESDGNWGIHQKRMGDATWFWTSFIISSQDECRKWMWCMDKNYVVLSDVFI